MVAVFVQMGDAAMKEGRVVAEQGILDGCLRKSVLLFAKAKQKVTVLFTDRGMSRTPDFPSNAFCSCATRRI